MVNLPPDIFSYDEVNRAIYNALRLELIQRGYLPDIKPFSATDDKAGWETARAAVKADKGAIIDVFGHGAEVDRDEKQVPRIVVTRKGDDRGTIGGYPATYYEEYMVGEQKKYRKKFYPDESKTLNYEVAVVTDNDNPVTDSYLSGLIAKVLGAKRFIPVYNSALELIPNKGLFLMYAGEMDYSKGNYIERAYRYRIMDVFVAEGAAINEGIVPLTTVTFGLQVVNSTALDSAELPEQNVAASVEVKRN